MRFIPQDGRPSVGYSNEQGVFSLQFNWGVELAELGMHSVHLEVPVESLVSKNRNTVPKDPKLICWSNQIAVTTKLAPLHFDLGEVE